MWRNKIMSNPEESSEQILLKVYEVINQWRLSVNERFTKITIGLPAGVFALLTFAANSLEMDYTKLSMISLALIIIIVISGAIPFLNTIIALSLSERALRSNDPDGSENPDWKKCNTLKNITVGSCVIFIISVVSLIILTLIT